MNEGIVTVDPGLAPALVPSLELDPWVADLCDGSGECSCRSMVAFDNFPCIELAQWYVLLDIYEPKAASPRWEGKLCNPCLAGWMEWSNEAPQTARVVSVNPIILGA